MKKEVTTTSKEVAGFDDSAFESLGPEQSLTSSDVQIPKILAMQAGSPRVKDGDAIFGQLVDTQNWEVLASAKEKTKFEFLPFHWEKYWINKYEEGGVWKFHSMEKINRKNEGLDAFEIWKQEGKEMKRIYTHIFYGLIPGKTIPYTLAFRGGSKKNGDVLVTQMFVINPGLKNVDAYLRSPMGAVMSIHPSKEVSKTGQDYIAINCTKSRESTKEEAVEALEWFNNVKGGTAKADLSEEDEVKSKGTHVPENVDF